MRCIHPLTMTALCCTGLVCAAAEAQKPPTRVTVEGQELPASIRAQIDALLEDEPPAESRFEARRQARRAADTALEVLNSEGWFAAEAAIGVSPKSSLDAEVTIKPGPRFTYSSVTASLEDATGAPKTDIETQINLTLKPGDTARAQDIITQEKQLVADLKDDGYADAHAAERTLIGDRDAATVDLTYHLQPGPRICFGELIIENHGRTQWSYLNTLSPITRGELYDGDQLDLYRRRLSETRLYSVSSVKLDKSNAVAGEGCEIRDVLVKLEDGKRRTVSLGASYASSEGLGVQGSFERRNFTGRGDTFNVTALAAELESGLNFLWTRPAFGGYGRKLTLGASATSEETDAYDKQAVAVTALYETSRSVALNVFVGAGLEVGQETDSGLERDLQIISGTVGFRYDTTDNALDPTQGFRWMTSLDPAYAFGDTADQFVAASTEGRAYFGAASDKLVFAGRLKAGSVYGASVDDLPSDRRFYAGGGGSVRGFDYQGIGPLDDDGSPTGGRSLLEGGLEARWRATRKFGIALFVDGGEVGSAEFPHFSDLRLGAGLGVRYFTRFGPLRLDIAAPVDRREGDDPFLFYISIGQAF